MATSVINLNHRPTPKYDIYVGREGRGQSGYFANRHTLGSVRTCPECFRNFGLRTRHDPEECMQLFETETLQRIIDDSEFRAGVLRLRDKVLACFCVKRGGSGPCHAKLYVRLLDGLPAISSDWDLVSAARVELARLAAQAVEASDGR